ncbi:MAG: hypothetical protein ACOC5T_03990 [Elusimicrobiota bacterium]
MKFERYLKESYYGSFETTPAYREMKREYVEVFKNPSTKELKNLMDIRFIATEKDIYVWCADVALHVDVYEEFYIEFAHKHVILGEGTYRSGKIDVYSLSGEGGDDISTDELKKYFYKVEKYFYKGFGPIHEEFSMLFKNNWNNKHVEVFENPSNKELREVGPYIRFILDGNVKKLYIWNSDIALHGTVWKQLGGKKDLSFENNVMFGESILKENKIKAYYINGIKRTDIRKVMFADRYFKDGIEKSVDDFISGKSFLRRIKNEGFYEI